MSRLKALWQGRLPLDEAFWRYAIFWGLLINVTATFAAAGFAVQVDAADSGPGLFSYAAIAAHLLPFPFNLAILVGVWRSAGNAPGRPVAAVAARTFVTLWATFLTLL
jgi:hypothetical protein